MLRRIYLSVASQGRGISGGKLLSGNFGLIPISDNLSQNHGFRKAKPWLRGFTTESGRGPLQNSSSKQGKDEAFTNFNDNDHDAQSMSDFNREQEAEEEFKIKLKILEASLNHVNTLGWSRDALRAGAADLSLSEAIASVCSPFDLVEYFQRSANFTLRNHLMGLEKKDKSLYSSLEYRLKLVTPYIDRYHQAMGLSLEPTNVPRSLDILRDLSDTVCINGLGDSSTDLRWYTKRTGIISLYVTTECCMIQDKSEDFQETWKFLERRVKDYEFFESAGSTAWPILESGVTTLLNILGMNRRR